MAQTVTVTRFRDQSPATGSLDLVDLEVRVERRRRVVRLRRVQAQIRRRRKRTTG